MSITDKRLIQLNGFDIITRSDLIDRIYNKLLESDIAYKKIMSMEKYKHMDKWDIRFHIGTCLDIRNFRDNPNATIHSLTDSDSIDLIFIEDDHDDMMTVMKVPVGDGDIEIETKEFEDTI